MLVLWGRLEIMTDKTVVRWTIVAWLDLDTGPAWPLVRPGMAVIGIH